MSDIQGRTHSSSIGSLDSFDATTLENIVKQDSNPYSFHSPCKSAGKIKLLDNIDLEKQLIIQAGGKRENVCEFVLKLALLMTVVLGSSVLIFYAL